LKKGFEELLRETVRGSILRDEPLSLHSSLRVGGPADWFIAPADSEDLKGLLGFLSTHGMPRLIIGGGFNLLVRDRGFRGAVISLDRFDRLDMVDNHLIRAEAGAVNLALVNFALERGLSGLEFLVGIPGRIGGALAMNAGVGTETITDPLETLVTLRDGSVVTTEKKNLEYGYRYLRLAPGEVIMEASFRLEQGPREEIRKRMDDLLAHRRASQQVGYPSAGSFFRNPPEGPAWRFIQSAGLKGFSIGGAQVSEVHANFLINRGGASAADFLALSAFIKDRVREGSGVQLVEEVRIVGEG